MHVCVYVYVCGREYLNVCPSPDIFVTPSFILQNGLAVSGSFSGNSSRIDPLPGLDTILEELLQEDGYVLITV